MVYPTQELIDTWQSRTLDFIQTAGVLKQQKTEKLHWREKDGKWNILECIEHLNLYGNFYIPEIRSAMQKSETKPAGLFKSGLLGNYFAQSMLPKTKKRVMKTFKDKDPIGRQLDKNVLERFIDQQKQILVLIETAKDKDLNKVKVKISISPWIKLKLGDTFRFLINHNTRHLQQIENIRTQIANADK